jgi:4-amino-4-deoxy-L-arabinose transferase-like glycosyltransferase
MLLTWHGATSRDPTEGFDAAAHVAYADVLREGRIPVEAETYEYASPPGYHWLADVVDRLAGRLALESAAASGIAQLAWLLLAVAGAGLTAARSRAVAAGGALLVLAAAGAAATEALARAAEVEWASGHVVNVIATGALLVVAFFLARHVWPRSVALPLAVVAATGALPIVFRLGSMFHPEALFAALGAAAILVFVRAERLGWPLREAVLLGALLGGAALVRQTALVLVAGLGAVALARRTRPALRFALVTAAALLVAAGPWWGYALDRYGNPIQSNLEREGYMLERQPRSFYVSAPVRDLVVHPYRPAFENELLPKFHADLWSDWFGGQQNWVEPTRAERVLASSQSVLGLAVSIGAPVALVLLGWPGARALARGRPVAGAPFAWATALVLASLTWVAFVVTLVRFPQAEGDPIKSSYMLFLAPVWALVAVRGGHALWERGGLWRVAVAAWTLLYACSYAGFLATSWR